MQPGGALHDLVLVGGGHSHALCLRRLGMAPPPRARITLISPESLTPYSGMLPGLVAGHYSVADTHIDLVRLCQWADVRLIRDRVIGLDADRRMLHLADGEPVGYDWLSLDVGSTPDLDSVPGAREHAVPVKPVSVFRHRWDLLVEQLRERREPARVLVVGGGAGGTEMVLAVAHALHRHGLTATLELVTNGPLLPDYPERLRRTMEQALTRYGIRLRSHWPVHRVEADALLGPAEASLEYDFLLWCTGARGAPWLADSALETTNQDMVRVDVRLRSSSHDNVFAAGDCAWLESRSLPRAGVHAVRQGPVLAANLDAAIRNRPLRSYRPQRRFLSLLSAGGRYAAGSRGGITVRGAWVWRWKNRIDRRFMEQFQQLPDMAMNAGREPADSTMRCAGCGAKVGPEALREALEGLSTPVQPEVLADFRAGEDAAVLRWPAQQLLVQSLDHFPAFIDDPFLFGRIAVLHALSDLHAMHARPHSALATVTVAWNHPRLQGRDLRRLMAGAVRELDRAGCTLLGGHSLEGPQMAAGFTVNGTMSPDGGFRKGGARPGDRLLVTGRLGTGIALAGLMHGRTRGPWLDAALEQMLESNATAADILADHGVSGCTDITGFGLLGHLLEILDASAVTAQLNLDALPVLEGALRLVNEGIHSTLRPANDAALTRCAIPEHRRDHPLLAVLTDPQTSAGLLAAVPAERAGACLEALEQAGYSATDIGECRASGHDATVILQ